MEGIVIQETIKLNSNGKIISLHQSSREETPVPNGNESSRSSNGGGEKEPVKISWIELF